MENENEWGPELASGLPQAFEEAPRDEEVQVTLAWLPLKQNHTQEERTAG